jgi:hypothetical protein
MRSLRHPSPTSRFPRLSTRADYNSSRSDSLTPDHSRTRTSSWVALSPVFAGSSIVSLFHAAWVAPGLPRHLCPVAHISGRSLPNLVFSELCSITASPDIFADSTPPFGERSSGVRFLSRHMGFVGNSLKSTYFPHLLENHSRARLVKSMER